MNNLAEVQAILRTNSLVVQVFTGNAAPLTAAAFLEPYSVSRLCGIRRIDLLEIQQIPAQGFGYDSRTPQQLLMPTRLYGREVRCTLKQIYRRVPGPYATRPVSN